MTDYSFAPAQVKWLTLASLAAGLLFGGALGFVLGLHQGMQTVADVSSVYEKALAKMADLHNSQADKPGTTEQPK